MPALARARCAIRCRGARLRRIDRQQRAAFDCREGRGGVDQLRLLTLLEERADHADRVVPALPPVIAANRHPCIVEADPRTGDQLRADQHEPAVGVVLRRAGLAGQIAAQAKLAADGRAGAGLEHAAHHVDQLLYHRRIEHALGDRLEALEHLAVAVADLRDQQRVVPLAERGQRRVGLAHLEQRDRAGAERERRHRIERRFAHAGGFRERDDRVRADRLHHLRGDRVPRLHQALAQGHRRLARAAAIGRLPDAAVGERNRDRRIEVLLLGRDAALQRGTVDERLEGRAWLAPGLRDMVELLAREIGAADPGPDRAVRRVDRDQTGREPRLVVAQARHQRAVGQHAGKRLRIGLAGGAGAAELRRVAGHLGEQRCMRLPEVGERLGGGTLAGRHRCRGLQAGSARAGLAPLLAGDALQQRHLLHNRVLREPLQFRIEGGADHQAGVVEVDIVRIGPVDQLLAQVRDEVTRQADVAVFRPAEIERQRQHAQLRETRRRQGAGLDHLRQHQVAPLARPLRVAHRVVALRALQHADQRRALRGVELLRGLVEVGPRGHLDAAHVVEEGRAVQVALEDLRLAAAALEPDRGDRLAQLAVQRDPVADLLGEQVAGELLGQRRAARHAPVQDAPGRADDAGRVDARVLVKAMVLGRDQRVDEVGRDILQHHRRLVGGREAADDLAVGRQDHARPHRLRALELLDIGRGVGPAPRGTPPRQ